MMNFCRCVSWYDTTQKTRSKKTSLSTVATGISIGRLNCNQLSEDSTDTREECLENEEQKMENAENDAGPNNAEAGGSSE